MFRSLSRFQDLNVASNSKRIGDLAEQLDAHRKRQQDLHPTLTMTGMYNVLEKLAGSGEKLTAKEQTIHEQGLVSVLKQIHDDLDAVVFDAYGWPHDLEDEEILAATGRPEPRAGRRRIARDRALVASGVSKSRRSHADRVRRRREERSQSRSLPRRPTVKKQPWPKTLPDRMVAVTDRAHNATLHPADAKESCCLLHPSEQVPGHRTTRNPRRRRQRPPTRRWALYSFQMSRN